MRKILTLTAAVVLLGLAGGSDKATAHAVSLSDASYPPSVLYYLKPGKGVTFSIDRAGHNCRHGNRRGWFSDVSAYRWNGKPLHAQRWNRQHDETFWIDHDDFAVTFDGITFFNDTRHSVIVAGWCE